MAVSFSDQVKRLDYAKQHTKEMHDIGSSTTFCATGYQAKTLFIQDNVKLDDETCHAMAAAMNNDGLIDECFAIGFIRIVLEGEGKNHFIIERKHKKKSTPKNKA